MSFNDPFAPIVKTPGLKFPAPSTKHVGTITKIGDQVQAKVFGKDEPKFWPSGDPVMQIPVTLQTGVIDPETPDHNGEWSLWVEIAGKQGSMLWAIREAIKAAGGQGMEVGAKLMIEFTGFDPESKNPQNPRKLYAAAYQPPAPAGADAFAPAAQPAYQQAPAQPAYQQAPAPVQEQQYQQAPVQQAPVQQAPVQASYDPAGILALIQQGKTTQEIQQTTGAPLQAIQAAQQFAQF